MRKLKLFIHCIMLAITPTLLAYPQHNLQQVSFQEVNYGYSQATEEWICPTTYDGIMQMLDDLESGEFEKRYSPTQLERINDYIATLAKEGILPDEFEEEAELEEDTYDLMYGEDSAFQLTRYLESSSEYMIMPSVLNDYSGYNIVQCGKISKAWKKTKKFVKKHKKAIIIGAVVVVTVTVVAVAVVASSSASAAVAGAAGAVASSGAESSDSGHSESKKLEPKEEPSASIIPKEVTPSIDTNEAPMMKAAIDEHVASFKEFLIEDKAAQQATGFMGWDEMSFGEKAREVGANVAHQAFDEVTDLVKIVPQLCEEVKELGAKFLPGNLIPPDNGEKESPMENYENLVAKGHEVIDNVFSTDQAELFTAESKANDPMNNFAIGMLPSPLSGSFAKIFSNTSWYKEAGKVLDRRGFTKAGRGLMKHGNREGSVFPRPVGNSAKLNKQGQMILEEILNDPNNKVYQFPDGSLKVYSPNGRGVSYKKDGSFKGFVEWQYE